MFTLLLFIGLFSSCGDDGLVKDCSAAGALNMTLAEETEKLTDVLTVFSLDQSSTNCDNVRGAYADYIDVLKTLQGCANEGGVGDEFRNSISEAESSLDTFGC